MAGQGAGPSRRSHTKSRKGCKTCKRRHIRCDEAFPQCRNCTKHQVRCDYMESVGSDSDSQPSPEQAAVLLTPSSESRVDLWQQTGSFPYPELHVFPPPQTHEYSKNELRLMHHLSSISNELLHNNTNKLTLWTQKMPKFLSIASTYPYVMHALLSFSANHLAWYNGSSEIRSLHIQHGGIALRGLHEAIGSFSHANADAVLAASLLMLWQATDWRSWSSLRAGIQSVIGAMHSWKHESLFAEYIAEGELIDSHNITPPVSPSERAAILQNAVQALERLQGTLSGSEFELHWVHQLLTYVQRLQDAEPAQTVEEQFSQLYYLRKWLFWVPISLLRSRNGQNAAMFTLSHFYAIAIALEPLFPDLGSSFCSAMALAPLETIINCSNAMQSQQALNASSLEIATLMQFPRHTALSYRNRHLQTTRPMFQQGLPLVSIGPETLSYTTMGNLSPAFAPSSLYYDTTQPATTQPSFLQVPPAQAGFGYGTQTWGVHSPAFLSQSGYIADEQMPDYMSSMRDFRGGTSIDPEPEAGSSQRFDY